MAELIIQSGKLKGKRLVLPGKDMVVGRDEGCDLRIASSLVSRKHCVLKGTAEGILVTDLDSQNGTHVNDVLILEPTLLNEGDTLRIGATVFLVPSAKKAKGTSSNQSSLVSDADIEDWLSENDHAAKFVGGDTAVIGSFAPASMTDRSMTPTPAPATISPTPRPAILSPPKPQIARVLSVKDEAAIVIQKHWESLKSKQKK